MDESLIKKSLSLKILLFFESDEDVFFILTPLNGAITLVDYCQTGTPWYDDDN